MLNFTDISWIGILAATVACFLLGGLWFSVLFGRAYSAALGRAHDPSAKPAPLMLIGPAVWGLVTAIVTSVLMTSLKVQTVGEAVAVGVFVGLGYLAPTTVNTGINPNIPRPGLYGLVGGTYHLLTGVVIAVIIVLL